MDTGLDPQHHILGIWLGAPKNKNPSNFIDTITDPRLDFVFRLLRLHKEAKCLSENRIGYMLTLELGLKQSEKKLASFVVNTKK